METKTSKNCEKRGSYYDKGYLSQKKINEAINPLNKWPFCLTMHLKEITHYLVDPQQNTKLAIYMKPLCRNTTNLLKNDKKERMYMKFQSLKP